MARVLIRGAAIVSLGDPEGGSVMTHLVQYDADGAVATVTLNRPERLNTMVDPLLDELLGQLERAADAPEIRVVVLRGAGRAFCAGGDLREGIGGGVGGDGTIANATGNLRRYMRISQLLHEMPKPTIAAVRGACAGAGLSLACAADLRYAGRTAVFATAFVNVGLSGDFGGTWTLSRLIGPARARAAYLLSDRISAEEAERIGLVTALVDEDELDDTVAGVAARLAAAPPLALSATKANLNDALDLPFSALLDKEAQRHIQASRTADAREATDAFLEKRKPVFQGR
jgi:2-(1,2-epoxy-1,2-dihydrophenyl)acetyl-CoA isomerase